MKKGLILFLIVFCEFTINAQAVVYDTLPFQKKKEYKYLGIQSNLLLQQFISFNSNSSINSNPFVFFYSKNDATSGKGTCFATGFNVSETSSNDGVTNITVQNANVTIRYGFERKFLQYEKLIPFWGMDFGAGVVYNKSVSALNQSFNNNKVTVESTRIFAGPAFRGGLNYKITNHILLGTEFFFNMQVAVNQINNGNGQTTQSFAPFNIGFQVPTALFLIFRY